MFIYSAIFNGPLNDTQRVRNEYEEKNRHFPSIFSLSLGQGINFSI